MDGRFLDLQWAVALMVLLVGLPHRGYSQEDNYEGTNMTYPNATSSGDSSKFPVIFFSALAAVILCTCVIGLTTCVRKARANAKPGRRGPPEPNLNMMISVVLNGRLSDALRSSIERNMEMDSGIIPTNIPRELDTSEMKLPKPPPYEEVQTSDLKSDDPPPSYSDSIKDSGVATYNQYA